MRSDTRSRNDDSVAKASLRALLGRGALMGAVLLALSLAGSVLGLPGAADAGGLFGRHHRHDFASPAELRDHAEFAVAFALDRVDASDEQQARVSSVVGELVNAIVPLGERHAQNREAWRTELARPEIDRAAIEALRRSELELADAASARLAAALADVAEILTPEQRAELIAWANHHHRD
jgi:Spy/CpxP family protein refolding chaperone